VQVRRDARLAELTTLGVGGPIDRLVEVGTRDELVAAVRDADDAGRPLLVRGGGSNIVAPDSGWPGDVVLVRSRGIARSDTDRGVELEVEAGESWDDLVAHTVAERLAGMEALSGIPGSTGATPVQNVGAYGQDVAQTIASVRTWDRVLRGVRTFAAADCRFGYRTSRFKADPGRFVVLDVTFQLRLGELGAPVGYAELARALGVAIGDRAPVAAVREAVLGLRRGKGMVLDAQDPDTWSAGSFFTNPVLPDGADLPEGAPRFPAPGGAVKTSAAWLIEHAGFTKGFGLPGPASLSTKHTLALTNRGDATAADLVALARTVRDGVRDRFGITLENEPVLVGLTL